MQHAAVLWDMLVTHCCTVKELSAVLMATVLLLELVCNATVLILVLWPHYVHQMQCVWCATMQLPVAALKMYH